MMEDTCAKCGLPRSAWTDDGYDAEGETYCCRGCAEGTGCTCEVRSGSDL